MESLAQLGDMGLGQFPLALQHFGNHAGCTEHIEQIDLADSPRRVPFVGGITAPLAWKEKNRATVMPRAEATLCRALIQLLASPSPESANRGGRQIEMDLLAELTGFSKRWVIELMHRLEKKRLLAPGQVGGQSRGLQYIR